MAKECKGCVYDTEKRLIDLDRELADKIVYTCMHCKRCKGKYADYLEDLYTKKSE